MILKNEDKKVIEDDDLNPVYYQKGGFEVIDLIEYFMLNFHLGNSLKYLLRAGKKTEDATTDLGKANWYWKRFLESKGILHFIPLILPGMNPTKEQVDMLDEVALAFELNDEVKEIVRALVGVTRNDEVLDLLEGQSLLEKYIEKYTLTLNKND